MADHYLKSLEYLDELAQVRNQLAELYSVPQVPTPMGLRRPESVQRQINALNPKVGQLLKLADIHATLSVRQALQDQVTGPMTFETVVRS